jgi:hypothetical protein
MIKMDIKKNIEASATNHWYREAHPNPGKRYSALANRWASSGNCSETSPPASDK